MPTTVGSTEYTLNIPMVEMFGSSFPTASRNTGDGGRDITASMVPMSSLIVSSLIYSPRECIEVRTIYRIP